MNDMTDKTFDAAAKTVLAAPDTTVDVRETFGIDIDWQCPDDPPTDEFECRDALHENQVERKEAPDDVGTEGRDKARPVVLGWGAGIHRGALGG